MTAFVLPSWAHVFVRACALTCRTFPRWCCSHLLLMPLLKPCCSQAFVLQMKFTATWSGSVTKPPHASRRPSTVEESLARRTIGRRLTGDAGQQNFVFLFFPFFFPSILLVRVQLCNVRVQSRARIWRLPEHCVTSWCLGVIIFLNSFCLQVVTQNPGWSLGWGDFLGHLYEHRRTIHWQVVRRTK